MQPAICLLSVVPLRQEPSHRSEMVSQLLFGEYVTTGEERDDFMYVKCHYDGYEGWVQANQLTRVSDGQVLATKKYTGVFAGEVLVDGSRRMIPLGSPIYSPENSAKPLTFGNRQVVYNVPDKTVWTVGEKPFDRPNLENLLSKFPDTPYLWGGKSVCGIDCSGFTQQVFKLFGVKLQRDAYLQAEQGVAVSSFDDAGFGDLAFFHNEKRRVTHVGILIGKNEIVHASGQVRVDSVDNKGISNRDNSKRTHDLHSIRKFF